MAKKRKVEKKAMTRREGRRRRIGEGSGVEEGCDKKKWGIKRIRTESGTGGGLREKVEKKAIVRRKRGRRL